MVQVISAQQVSKLTGIGLTNVYRLARQGKIPCMRVNKKYLFTAESIEEWITDQIENHTVYQIDDDDDNKVVDINSHRS